MKDAWDVWHYPAGEMWVDWVKVWDLKDIVVPDYTCKANPDRSESDLCGAANVSFQNIVWQIAFSRT